MAITGNRHHLADIAEDRQMVRYVAAALAAACAIVYFLIGARAVTVIDDTGEQVGFGLAAGIGFLAAAAVIVMVDRRLVWVLGAVAQAFIIFAYFDLAAERTPQFEFWGILLRVFQFALLGVLVYLAIRPKRKPG